MTHYPIAEIDLAALRHNFAAVRQQTQSKILAMIKANAYGHGIVPIAQALSAEPQLGGFGVARLNEALSLRAAGIQQMILVMGGLLTAEEFIVAREHQLAVVVHSGWQIDVLENLPTGPALAVWLKLDVGMHRLGFIPEEAEAAYQRLMQCTNIKKPFVTLAHFSSADERDNPLNQQQAEKFFQLTQHWQGEKSLARSAALLTSSQVHADWVRPGILLYGASPFADQTAQQLNLKPVMTLSSKIVAIRELKKGETIGYNATWECPEDMRVAIIGIGYGDGYPRHAKSGTPVLIAGKHLPLVGRVSMDMIAVDLRGANSVQIGDKAILWGEGLPAETVAKYADTISYELFCRLTGRVKFVYK